MKHSKDALAFNKEEQEKKYKVNVKDLQDRIRTLTEEKSQLQTKLKEAELEDYNNKAKVKTLEDLLARLESGVTKLENNSERETVLNEQIERLENQIAEVGLKTN